MTTSMRTDPADESGRPSAGVIYLPLTRIREISLAIAAAVVEKAQDFNNKGRAINHRGHHVRPELLTHGRARVVTDLHKERS